MNYFTIFFILLSLNICYCWPNRHRKNRRELNPISNENTISHLVFQIQDLSKISNSTDNLDANSINKIANNTYLKYVINDDLNVDMDKAEQIGNDFQLEKSKPRQPFNTCTLQPKVVELYLGKECGQVNYNTTVCSGLCRSGEKLIGNIKKTECSACKAIRHVYIRRQVKCTDSTVRSIFIKQVTECSCFKLSDTIETLNTG